MRCTAEGLASTKAARLDQIKGGGPESSAAEEQCSALVETFASELLKSSPHLKERLPLLRPANENGVEKFICTFLKPTLLPYPELFDLQSCASFVANFIQYEPLEADASPTLTVVSPAQTLDWAVGDCFDCSFLLASLLIGAGFDAFVVCGTAPDWLRLRDQSHMALALQSSDEDDAANQRRVETLIEDKHYAQKPSQGDGIHCWLLVKAGKRDIFTTVFVEPSTSVVYPCDDSPYTRVHSVCNDKNCWINTGDGSISKSGLDFTNSETWRTVLPEGHVAPFSWVRPLDLPKERFRIRYPPDGKRTITLDRCKIVLFGKGIDPQALVSQAFRYEDSNQLIVVECEETYCSRQREDHLIRRTRRPLENQTHELLSNKSNMIERSEAPGMRSVAFHEKTRADGLVERREKFGSTITEHFRNRSDGLVRREVHLLSQSDDTESPKKTLKPELVPLGDGKKAAIERIDEHFDVSTGDLESSVASRSYLLQERCIKVKCHCEHPVLQKEDIYRKDDLSSGDSLEKELLKLESASVSEVKRTQAEMNGLNEAKYQHEMSTLATDASQTSASESSSSSNPGPGKTDEKGAGATFDYLSPYLQGKGPLTKEDALQVKKAASTIPRTACWSVPR